MRTSCAILALVLAGCSPQGHSRSILSEYGGEDYYTAFSHEEKNEVAKTISGSLLDEFGRTRGLSFDISGRSADKHSDIIIDFISRMADRGGVYFPSNPELVIQVDFESEYAARSVRRISISVHIDAVRQVAFGEQRLRSKSVSGTCSDKISNYPMCELLERKLIENALYQLDGRTAKTKIPDYDLEETTKRCRAKIVADTLGADSRGRPVEGGSGLLGMLTGSAVQQVYKCLEDAGY